MRRAVAILAIVAVASTAMAVPTLTQLAPLAGQTSSEARAITPDGRWIAGSSGTSGALWDAQNPGVAINVLGGTMQSEYVRGIAYRTEPVQGRQELMMLGKTANSTGPTYWMYRPSDGTWGLKLRHTNEANTLPAANALAAHATQSDAVFAGWGGYTSNSVKVGKVWGGTSTVAPSTIYDAKSTTEESGIQAVSSNGRAVGWRKASTVPSNYVIDFVDDGIAGTAPATYFAGLAGTNAGQAWAISADGSIVGGMSPVADGRSGNWPYMAVLSATRTLVSIVELPSLNAAAASNQGIVYGMSADGRWGVGRDYTYGYDRAVLWDLQAMTILDLTEFASQKGILGSFTSLDRAYSVGVNAGGEPVITGIGGSKGFVLTVPEPTSLLLLGIGGLALIRRR